MRTGDKNARIERFCPLFRSILAADIHTEEKAYYL